MRILLQFFELLWDNFALCHVRIYPGVNSRAELVTLAPGVSVANTRELVSPIVPDFFYLKLLGMLDKYGYYC